LCLAFDDRETLQPLHVWLIPGFEVNHLTAFAIPNSSWGILKWSIYEKPLDRVLQGCEMVRGAVVS
jgi:hypothetical protein